MKQQSPKADVYIGRTTFRNEGRLFGIAREDRLSHMYIIGKTGTGKSTLLRQLALQDMKAGTGFAFIDPHGDVATALATAASKLPDSRAVYLDCSSPAPAWALNVFAGVDPARRALAAESIVDVFRKLWDDDWGPRLEHVLRAVVWTLLENPGTSFDDIPDLLTNRERRRALTAMLENEVVKRFWIREFEGYSPAFRAVVTAPVLNKIGAFLANPSVRAIVSAPQSSFDARVLMDGGGILIANLAKGVLGESSSNLLGSLLVSLISQAALGRADASFEVRRAFILYLDEFQSFTTLNLVLMFAELRKFRVGLVVAHQYFGQLHPAILDSVLANAGSLVVFRPAPDDVERLAWALRRPGHAEDLLALKRFHFMARVSIAGEEPCALSARANLASPPD